MVAVGCGGGAGTRMQRSPFCPDMGMPPLVSHTSACLSS